MHYIAHYNSPMGPITMASDGKGLSGLWFDGQKYFASTLKEHKTDENLEIFNKTREWLDRYFKGEDPGFMPPLSMDGSDFRKEVWEILLSIPFGKLMSYGEIAGMLAERRGLKKFSAQAVGGAVGHNPVSIIVPCHRVVGSNGSLTGYAGGVGIKYELLKLEGVDMSKLTVPTKGTAI